MLAAMAKDGKTQAVPPRPDTSPEDPGPPPATWRAVESVPVGLIAGVMAIVLETAFALAFLPDTARSASALADDPGLYAFATYVLPLCTVATVLFWIRFVDHGRFESLGLPPRRPLGDLAIGAGAAVVMVLGTGIVLQITSAIVDAIAGHHVSNPDQIPTTVSGPLLATSGVAIVLLAPIAEETFFRGFLYKGLRRRFSTWPAAVISGFFFGLIHANGGLRFFLIVPSLWLLGVVLAIVYERRQSLLASVAMHATFNLIGFAFIVSSRYWGS